MSAIERARCAIGAPYRRRGRDLATGVDCLGLMEHVFEFHAPRTLELLAVDEGALIGLSESKFLPSCERRTGNVLVMRRRGRWHFAVIDGDAFIHADARARKVVRRRGATPWPVKLVLREKRETD